MTLGQWSSEVEAAALLGTSRRRPPPLPSEIGVEVQGNSAERLLLGQAALLDVIERAGKRPDFAPAMQPSLPEVNTQVASKAASRLLSLLLTQSPVTGEDREDLMTQWLIQATEKNQTVPPSLLIDIMEAAKRSVTIRTILPSAWGKRGEWLAQFTPDMKTLSIIPPMSTNIDELVESWPELTSAVALEYLRMYRQKDPAGARCLVQKMWDTLPAKQRASHLDILSESIEETDEILFDHALDDKAKSVREAAQKGLDLLTSGARIARMQERLRPLIAYKKGIIRSSIELGPASKIDDQWVHDGLPKPASDGTIPIKAVDKLISLSPLKLWEEITELKPKAIIKLMEGQPSVINALSEAAAREKDPRWAEALLPHYATLVTYLNQNDLHKLVLSALSANKPPNSIFAPLHALETPWKPKIVTAVLRHLANQKTSANAANILTSELGKNLSNEGIELVSQAINDPNFDFPPATQRNLARAVQHKHFQQSILEAFDD